jgi:hypothetical protein
MQKNDCRQGFILFEAPIAGNNPRPEDGFVGVVNISMERINFACSSSKVAAVC